MSGRVNITAISYLNTLPFVYGIEHAEQNLCADLLLNVPSSCHELLNSNQADIGLIPIANLGKTNDVEIISDYCIGCQGNVRTVVLMANVPLGQIQRIYLDTHSATSVILVRILARERWNINVTWLPLTDSSQIDPNSSTDGYLLIGDKVFDYEDRFSQIVDLGQEWLLHTSLPFVFAVWVAKHRIGSSYRNRFNEALRKGLENRDKSLKGTRFENSFHRSLDYLKHNISYDLNDNKKKAIALFLQKAKEGNDLLSPG